MRPSDYNPSSVTGLGPGQPSPHLNLAAVGLTPGLTEAILFPFRSSDQPKPDQENVLALQNLALQDGAFGPPEIPTKVVCLTQVVSPDELRDDDEFEDILEDMREECGKHGPVVNLVIPRPEPSGQLTPGVGKVFVEYSDTDCSAKAKASLNGRKFGRNVVVAVYYPEDKFSRGEYE